MLGSEGWKPTGTEAAEIGLATEVVSHGALMPDAQNIAAKWAHEGKTRAFRGSRDRDALKAVNASESIAVADAFLASPFLEAQYRFLRSKKKRRPALMFLALWKSRPLWGRLL